MSQLWEPNPYYDPSKPQSLWNMPYKRLYDKLTPEQLAELLRDAEAQQWKVLDLSNTLIREVPESITRLSSLQILNLSVTPISAVPESIGNLKNLKRLDLCGCHLKAIPYSLVTLGLPFVIDDRYTNKICINLTGVTLDEGDLQLFAQPHDVIEAYYRGQKQTLRECKVIFLGDGAVGKTSLIERIVNGTFTPGTPPTAGIEVTKWYMSVKATEWETTVDDAPFTVRFLDFGGQEIMHAAHRCFLTAHTVYVVVCDSRDDEKIDDIASYWLESVKAFAPDCPVILALNKADLNPNASVNERDLKERNPALKRVLRTSAALEPEDDYGVSELIRAIRKQIPGAVNQYKVNVDMLRVKQALEDMREQEGTGYITSERYREICEGHHITDKKLQYDMLGFFRDLGIAYYYETPSIDTRLESVRVLNPEWLTNGIYRLILRTPESGFLRHKEIKKTLRASHAGDVHREITYTPEETEYILHVMRYFEISHDIGGGVEMIPLKMQKTPPPTVDDFQKANALHLRWEGTYLPSNLIHRLLIRKFRELDVHCVWRTGGHFRRGECEALAQMNEKALDVYVTPGRDCRQYMETFRVEIQDILSKLNLKEVSEIICHTVNGREGRVSYQAALSHLYNHKEEIYLANIDAFVSPVDLMKEIYVDVERELKRYRMEWEREYRDMKPTETAPESPIDEEIKKEELIEKRRENNWKHIQYVGIMGGLVGALILLLFVAVKYPDKLPELWEMIKDFLPGS